MYDLFMKKGWDFRKNTEKTDAVSPRINVSPCPLSSSFKKTPSPNSSPFFIQNVVLQNKEVPPRIHPPLLYPPNDHNYPNCDTNPPAIYLRICGSSDWGQPGWRQSITSVIHQLINFNYLQIWLFLHFCQPLSPTSTIHFSKRQERYFSSKIYVV